MSIHVDSCAELETIVAKTRSSVYELVVLRRDRGDVLLRGADVDRTAVTVSCCC
jgi:hypothetical protein